MQARTLSAAKLRDTSAHADHCGSRSAVDHSKLLDHGMHLTSAATKAAVWSRSAAITRLDTHGRSQSSSEWFGNACPASNYRHWFPLCQWPKPKHPVGRWACGSRRDALSEPGPAGVGLRTIDRSRSRRPRGRAAAIRSRRSSRCRSAGACTWHSRCCCVHWRLARGCGSTPTGPPRGTTWSTKLATETYCGWLTSVEDPSRPARIATIPWRCLMGCAPSRCGWGSPPMVLQPPNTQPVTSQFRCGTRTARQSPRHSQGKHHAWDQRS